MTTTLLLLSFLLLLMSVLPSFRITHWSVQVFDYIRIQVLFIQLVVLVGSFFLYREGDMTIYVAQIVLFISMVYQLFIILPYVPIRSWLKKTEPTSFETSGKELSIVSSNVLQKNDEYHKLIDLVKNIQPDNLLTTETNKEWENALKVLEDNFSFNHKIALENRYG
ncbi:MAG: hypothetical protein GX857_07115, partial [Bacteroidales bacterium]|nr:hypothetical protein [Bacteroidales bacterium]